MISNNYQTNNYVAFKGMNPANIKRFIPKISDEMANKVSKHLDNEIPCHVLEILEKNDNTRITHSIKNEFFAFPVGEIKYPAGHDTVAEKINFLCELAKKIKNGTLYK